MKKQSRTGCFLTGGFLLLVVLAIGGWLIIRAFPSVENMVPATPMIVDLLAPDDGTEIVVGDSLSVRAKALSLEHPLATFELWVDGQLLAQEATSGNSAETGWAWQALNQGIHTLVVRVRDTQGRTGQSQVVIVNVLEGNGKLQVHAQEGQTLGEIGAQFGVPPGQMAESNPGVDPAQSLPGGQPVQVPAGGGGAGPGSGAGGGQAPGGPTQAPKTPAHPLVFWFSQTVAPILNPPAPPLAPQVALTSNNCKFQLYLTPQSNNASGFIVYRWTTGDAGFHKIATLGAGQPGMPILFEDTIQPVGLLAYLYYVSAFNASGEAPSSIVGQAGQVYNCAQEGPGDLIQVDWTFSPQEPVDQFYCYESNGKGNWMRVPADPFVFFDGQNGKYQQVGPFEGSDETQIQVECWGWLGGVLKYLGKGGAKVDLSQPPEEVMIAAGGFQLTGQPQFKPKPVNTTGGGQLTVPMPYALREAGTAAECASHYGNPLAGLVCNGLMNAPVKEYDTLVWEWQPETCWPGTNCVWVNDIDGYHIYEIDPATNAQKYLKDVGQPGQKVTAVPLPWGYRCYGVEAYAQSPASGGEIVSGLATYCPGEPPQPEKLALAPSTWLTTGGEWIQDGDCDSYGGLENYTYYQNQGWLDPGAGQVLVGSYIVDDEEEDCFRQGDYSGAVKFLLPGLQPGAAFQKATLKFSSVFNDYEATGLATNYKLFCAGGLGKAKQDWTSLGEDHFLGSNVLYSYNTPLSSLSGWKSSIEVDVTSAVSNWLKHPEQNHGFILTPANAPGPLEDGHGTCFSGVGNFQLEIYYLVPEWK